MLLIFKKDKIQTIKKALFNPITTAFILYVFMNYLGVLTSDNTTWSLDNARAYKFFLFSFLVVVFARYEYIERIFASFIAGIVLSSLVSYALIFKLIEAPFLFSYKLAATFSNPSPFMYHIEFGFLLAFSSLILLQMLYKNRSKNQKIFIGFLFILISVSIFLNISRTGYIIYLLGITLFYFLHFRNKFIKFSPLLFLFFTVLITSFYLSSSTFKQRINVAFNDIEKMYYYGDYDTSLGYRVVEAKQAYTLILENPIMGYGTSRHVSTMYEDAKEKKLFYADTIKYYSTTDNQYLDVLLQWGVFGLFIFLNIFYQGFKYKQEDKGLREIQLILLILYFINGLQTYTMLGQLPYTFFFILSLTAIRKTKNSKKLAPITIKHSVAYLFFLVLATLTAPYIL